MVVVPDKQTHANESQQKLEDNDENIDHNSRVYIVYFDDLIKGEVLSHDRPPHKLI